MTSINNGGNFECCMCGDTGLSNELFRCKICQFRSQHRYCSNQFPNADSYRICNWCLIQNDSSNSSEQVSKKKGHVGPAAPTKKLRRVSSEAAVGRKRVAANAGATPVTRHVFRNKVRRYKLLEEVSS